MRDFNRMNSLQKSMNIENTKTFPDVSNDPSYINYTPEFIESTSIEYIIHDIRFRLCKDVSVSDIKALLLKLIYTPVRNPELMNEFANLLNNGNYDKLFNFVTKNANHENKALIDSDSLSYKHNFDKEFDLYLTTADPETALNVLRTLIFTKSTSQTLYEATLKHLQTADEQLLKDIVGGVIYDSVLM
jgi:hypothetical protein